MIDPKIAPPELEAPSLGQGPPKPKVVHALIADDLVVDLAELFGKMKEAAVKPLPSAEPAKPSHAELRRATPNHAMSKPKRFDAPNLRQPLSGVKQL